MEKDDRSDRHLSKKKEHTRIKHAIFSGTLKVSLYIANMLAPRSTYTKGHSLIYTYIDLFAGRGKFEDEEEGSPLIAFNIFKDHLCSSGAVKTNFSRIRFIAIEKRKEDADYLRNILGKELGNAGCQQQLEVYVEDENWEKHRTPIRQFLSESQWGFIFADPFSTELDIDKLIELIQSYKSFKDIIIWVNFRTLQRQAERQQGGDIERVCRSLGVKAEQLSAGDFRIYFRMHCRKSFRM